MVRTVAVNGSPRKDKGNTALVLNTFIEGMLEAGSEVDVSYTSRMKIKPCSCGEMRCWYAHPGECVLQDDMRGLYPKLREAEILLLATPVYIPLPGDMQNFINRLCPLVEPRLEWRQGRTRARPRHDVKINKIALVATGGWWEKENMATVEHITRELAEDMSVDFAGAVLRPHAFVMKKGGMITPDGQAVLEAVKQAGIELVRDGRMNAETLEQASRPLISEEELRAWYNRAI